MSGSDLATLLDATRRDLVRYAQQRGGRLLRYETAEDLAQGITLRALDRSRSFEFRGDEQAKGWLFSVARSYLIDRQAHWAALKRRSGKLLRITFSQSSADAPGAVIEPGRKSTGPATFADRREQVTLAVKALAALLPRDRQLVGWYTDGLPLEQQAERLGISYAATQRAAHRALERFRKAFLLLS